MLLIAAAVTVMVAVAIIARMRQEGANASRLGCMSEQWLAEYRASHSL